MKFKILTLADISKTHARRDEDPKAWRQQQNFNTLFGTISLRANAIPSTPKVSTRSVGNLGFGSKYKGKHKVWEVSFKIEAEAGHSLNLLNEDVDLIPLIDKLDETIEYEQPVFRTKCAQNCNIIFTEINDE